jgi:hypothetical protein
MVALSYSTVLYSIVRSANFLKLPLEIYANPHNFIAITKATACGGKKPLLPHPLYSPVGGGCRGCYLHGPEDLLNKNVSYT